MDVSGARKRLEEMRDGLDRTLLVLRGENKHDIVFQLFDLERQLRFQVFD